MKKKVLPQELIYNNFLYDNKFFNIINELKKILKKKVSLNTKQKNIEKLMNVFLLEKKEKIYTINPLWNNLILKTFNNYFIIFDKYYKRIRIEYNFNKYYYIDYLINNCLTSEILFNICIYSFLLNLHDNFFKEEHRFIEDLTKNLLSFFDTQLKYVFLDLNKDLYINKSFLDSKNYFSWRDQIEAKYKKASKKKDYLLTYNTIIYEDLKNIYKSKKDLNIEYTNLITKFRSDFQKDLEKNIRNEILRFSYIINEFLLNNDKINLFEKFKGKIGHKTYDYMQIVDLKVFNKINTTHYLLNNIPMITPPLDWDLSGKFGGYLLNKHDCMPLTKPLNRGYSHIEYSTYLINSINILQKKKYKINKKFLNYIQTPLFKKHNKILDDKEFRSLILKFKKAMRNSEKLKGIEFFFKEFNFLQAENSFQELNSEDKEKKFNAFLETFSSLLHDINIKEEFNCYTKYLEYYKEFYFYFNNIQQYTFVIELAKSLIDYDLYIPNKLDFRGRMYPLTWLLSRTSGIYKHLLLDENDISNLEVCLEEREYFLNLLKEYITVLYKPVENIQTKKNALKWFDNNILKPFLIIEPDLSIIHKTINEFVYNLDKEQWKTYKRKKNIKNKSILKILIDLLDKSKKKDLFLIYLNEYFALSSKNSFRMEFPLEYDQSSSGPMIYSLLSQDLNMAKETNLTSEEQKKDIYTLFLNIFKKDNKILKEEDLKFFTRNDFGKKLIMPIFYNMGDKGIFKLIKSIFDKNALYLDMSFEERSKKIESLIKFINDILNSKFSDTINFQKGLVDMCKLLTKNNSSIIFYTLDGSLIQYKYLKFDTKFGSIKKGKKRKTYKIYIPLKENNKNVLDGRHHTTFPPNFIQSIDGSICRMVLTIFYKITNKILEPLHDSFRISLNDLSLLNYIIKYIYIFNFLNKEFHSLGIGLNIKTLKIELKSEYYLKYKEYFDFKNLIDKEKNDLVLDHFINPSLVNIETKTKMLDIYTVRIKKEKVFKKKTINKIIKSHFMFYF